MDIGYTYGTRIRIKKGWSEFGKVGTCLGNTVFVEQEWIPVLWDNEDDPDFFKLAGIERLTWYIPNLY